MQSELKPCPFCGGDAYIDDDTMGHSVVCCKNIECRAQGPFRPTDDEAIAAWNTRASDAEITRLTEALRAAEEREKGLREALVQHNDRLRSAAAVAARDGRKTNWLSFRGQVRYTLTEYHELVKEARAELERIADE